MPLWPHNCLLPLCCVGNHVCTHETPFQPPVFTDSNNNRSNNNHRKGCSTYRNLARPGLRGRPNRCCSQLCRQHADVMWWAGTHNAHFHWFIKGCVAASTVKHVRYVFVSSQAHCSRWTQRPALFSGSYAQCTDIHSCVHFHDHPQLVCPH